MPAGDSTMNGTFPVMAAFLLALVLSFATCARNSVWHDVVSLCEDINEKSPDKGRAFALMGSYYAGTGDYQKAIDSFSEAIRRKPHIAKLYVELAKVYRQIGDPEQEYLTYRSALSAGINDARVHAGLGDMFFRQMDLAQAQKEFESAAALDPGNAHAQYKLGLIDMAHGRNHASISRFNKALLLDPDNQQYREYLAEAYARAGNSR